MLNRYTIIACTAVVLLANSPSEGTEQAEETCSSDVMDLAAKGKLLFHGKAVCAGCHGEGGKGDSDNPQIAQLNPKPTNLTDPTKLRFPSDEQRLAVIRNGIRGTAMPPFRGHLTSEEMLLLIEYLEVLKTGGC